jgi:hypothetical protein
MKSRFCESNYWNVLEGFLSVLLKHQVHIQRLIRRKTIQQEESSLVNRIDILAIEDSRDPVLVRIQTFRELAYFHRLRYGTPCIAAETDVHVAKLYTINVMFLDIGHHKDYIYCGNQSLSGLHYPDDEIWSEGRYRTLFFDEEAEYTQYVHYLILVNEFDQVARTPPLMNGSVSLKPVKFKVVTLLKDYPKLVNVCALTRLTRKKSMLIFAIWRPFAIRRV